MDQVFFSWLAAQPYSVEVTIGAVFVILIAPAVLAGMAALATWVERPIGELLRMSGLMNTLDREEKNLWRLRTQTRAPERHASEMPATGHGEHSSRATSYRN